MWGGEMEVHGHPVHGLTVGASGAFLRQDNLTDGYPLPFAPQTKVTGQLAWNLFNARAHLTGRSAFHFKGCQGFLAILVVILVGQLFIVNLGGQMFSVTPISVTDWLIIISSTSLVLWFGEIYRLVRR